MVEITKKSGTSITTRTSVSNQCTGYKACPKNVHAFEICGLDYSNCRGIFLGLQVTLMRRLQTMRNASERLVTENYRFDHVSSVYLNDDLIPIRK